MIIEENKTFRLYLEGNTVCLKFSNSPVIKKIGVYSNGDLFIERDLQKHLMIKLNTFGFNFFLVTKLDFKNIILSVSNKGVTSTFKLEKKALIENSRVMGFSSKGLDLQYFPSTEFIQQNKI